MEAEEILRGEPWLGHPAHPVLVTFPIGLWVFGTVLDMAASVIKSECVQDAADMAITGGLVGAGLAATTGLAEYGRVPKDERAQDDAFTHGALNAAATALFGINAAIRSSRRKNGKSVGFLPKLLSAAGVGIIGYTGWLGGKLVYDHGTAVKLEDAIERREEEQKKAKPVAKRREEKAHV